jgi:hypothetical protein
MGKINVGTGTSISFGTSGFTADILDISPPNASRVSIETSHMGTTTAHTFTPGDLVDWGELGFDIVFDPTSANIPPIKNSAETVTITFPDSGASTWAFSAFVITFDPGVPMEDRATASVSCKVSGDITVA